MENMPSSAYSMKNYTLKSPAKKRSTAGVLIIVFCVFLFCGGVVVLLLPGLGGHHEAARRMQCQNNMKQIGLATLTFESARDHFPSYDSKHPEYPPCSWRVQMLPFIENGELYEYDRTQPWNSTTNIALEKIQRLPYQCPSNPDRTNRKNADTDYLSIVGPHSVFREKGSAKPDDITDGTSNTIMFVESSPSGIHWMEPRDLRFEDARIIEDDSTDSGIRSHHPGVVNITLCDGSVRDISKDIDPKLLKALMTIDGGESVEGFRDQ